jgi:hypothetical protein
MINLIAVVVVALVSLGIALTLRVPVMDRVVAAARRVVTGHE